MRQLIIDTTSKMEECSWWSGAFECSIVEHLESLTDIQLLELYTWNVQVNTIMKKPPASLSVTTP